MSKGNIGKKYRPHKKYKLRKHFASKGQRFGWLVVLSDDEVDFLRGKSTVRGVPVACDCGTELIASVYELRRGSKKSCGCMLRNRTYRMLSPGIVARNTILGHYVRAAKDRGYAWELTEEDFDDLTSSDCFYCGIPPSAVKKQRNSLGEFIYNGIDRKDNSQGYVRENVVPCCRLCNQAKMDNAFDDFMAWIARLTAYQNSLHAKEMA